MPRDLRRRLEEHLQCNLRQSGSSPSSKFDARQDTDRGRLYGCRLPVGGGRSTCIKVQSCLVVIVVTSAPPIPFGSKNGAFTCGFAYVQPHVFDYAADVRRRTSLVPSSLVASYPRKKSRAFSRVPLMVAMETELHTTTL